MNNEIRLKTHVNILNSLVRSRLTFAFQTWTLSARHRDLLMIRNGFKKKEDELSFVYTNTSIYRMCGAEALEEYIRRQQKR